MKAVKFLKSTQLGALYSPGEVAGFPEETADLLIKQKFAEPFKDDAKKEKAPVTAT